MKRLVLALVWAALLVLAAADFGHAAVITTTWGYDGTDYNWGTGGNWDLGVPNNGATDQYIAEINDPDTVSVNGGYTINALNLTNALGIVNIGNGKWLKLMTGTSTNIGTIRLNDIGTGTANLYIDGAVNLGGTGSVEFFSSTKSYISGSGSLTLGAGQKITTASGGEGEINVAVTNNGRISADGGTIALQSAGKVNQGTIESVNSGTLNINSITLDNTGGTLTAGAGSTINLSASTIQGGISGTGNVDVAGISHIDGTAPGGAVLTPVITVGSSDYLHLKGDITNDGQIRLNDTTTGVARLYMDGAVNLNGDGSVEFLTSTENYINDGGSGYLNVGADQKIKTTGTGSKGDIYVGMTNNGRISADDGIIALASIDKINNGIIEAVSGGTLNINSITLDNTGGTLTVDGASTIKLSAATIQGGISGTGNVDVAGISHIDGSAPGGAVLTPVITAGSSDYLHLEGDITNNGKIRLNDTTTGTARLYMDGAVTLGGTGSVEFLTSTENYIDDGGSGYLTVGAGQTIHAGSGTNGEINVAMTNNGLINADGGTIALQSTDKVNHNIIRAIGGGTLNINSITLDNTGGTLTVDGASTINLSGATIQGGISGTGNVNVAGTSYIDGTGGAVLTPVITTGNYKYLHLLGDITNNGQIRLNDTGTGSAILYMDGAVTLGGTGSVEFLTSGTNYINDGGSGYLNVGAGQTIHAGTGTNGAIYVGMTNQGLVSADGGTMALQSTNKVNQGDIESKNSGTLNITNIILDNTAGTLSVDDTSIINLSGATIQGGISGDGNVNLTAQSTIDGTAPGGATLTPVITTGNYKYLHLMGDIFNNGQIRVNDTGTGSAILYMDGAVNLGGTGSVEFFTGNQNYINDGGSGHLNVGAGQTIRAGAGTAGTINVATTNHGTLEADGGILELPSLLTNNGLVRSAQGSTLAVDNSVGGTGGWQADGGTLDVNDDVSTSGDIEVRNSGLLDLAASQTMTGSDLLMDSTGSLFVGDSAILALTGNLGFAMTDESLWNFGADSSLLMNGAFGYQALEIGGEDLGFDAAGFNANFDLEGLELEGSGTFAYLSDALDNGNRHSPEALYVSDLSVLEGTTLNLNGLSLYTYLGETLHLVMAGEGDLFGGGEIVDFDQPASTVPVPAAVWLLGSGLLGLVGLRRKFGRIN